MSKESKEPKNYSDYGYIGDETVTITVPEFVALQKALDQAIQNGVVAQHPQIVRWFDKKTGKAVDNPTNKQLQEKTVQQFADSQATSSQENLQISYNANLFPAVFSGREVAMGIHQRMVDEGVAKPTEELKRIYEERQAKGQMKIQDEDVVDAEEVVADKPQPKMDVVKDEPTDTSVESKDKQ